ncbi:hypothetical protein ADL15_23720 [Actinoplanes awajinensis subsp. mycoplanecinus]|uniref:Uncharacterized protein n=1 Tax=Actinoplanes awajinensis subsp. mycoplanecinus TaxID=135947 RepID=A0A101JQ68_9ACTN|nr:hypothetical protein ADL15_23720 [Actinoplanes awajinensis subsp. mycoplanecinus]
MVIPSGGGSLRGIVYANCSGSGTYDLASVDPSTGAAGERRTFLIEGDESVAMDCNATVPGGFVKRQMFNRDFTRMAASITVGNDETHIGYVTLQRTMIDLTPLSRGYGGTRPDYVGGVFNPADGRIWFESKTSLGSVDADAGPPSLKMSATDAFGSSLGDFRSLFWFSPDGKVPQGGFGFSAFSPDGKTQVEYSPSGFTIGPEIGEGTTTVSGPELCWPKQFVDDKRFLCLQAGGAHQVYLMTVSDDRKRLTQKPLLPESDKTVSDVLPSPDATAMAFVSDGMLYTVPLSGSEEPAQVGDGSSGSLLAWLP